MKCFDKGQKVGGSKYMKIKVRKESPAPLKGRVFKIQKKSRTIFDQINAITH